MQGRKDTQGFRAGAGCEPNCQGDEKESESDGVAGGVERVSGGESPSGALAENHEERPKDEEARLRVQGLKKGAMRGHLLRLSTEIDR